MKDNGRQRRGHFFPANCWKILYLIPVNVWNNKVKNLFTPDKYKIIIIPSYRTPERVIKKAYNTFNFNHHVIKKIDKRAYLSSLSISDYIVVTCDSTSMISEAAITGKPVYIAMMKAIRNNYRFKNFYTIKPKARACSKSFFIFF